MIFFQPIMLFDNKSSLHINKSQNLWTLSKWGDPPQKLFLYFFLADWGQGARSYFGNAKKFMIFFHDSVPKINCWNVGLKVELKKIKTFSLKVLLKICFHDKKTMLPLLETLWLLLCTQELKLCPNLVEGTTNSIDHSYLHLSHWNWLGKMS